MNQLGTASCRRQDEYMFMTVEMAICMGDTHEAAQYMADCGVPFAVAHRVLLHPNKRRKLNG